MRAFLFLTLVAACGSCGAKPAPPPSPAQGPAAGQICGTRGVAECPATMFCNFEPGADCGATDHPGHCMVAPEVCAEIYQPVCGCDGTTHPNSCQAAAAKTGVKAAGECAK
jgi:hypothetical protein